MRAPQLPFEKESFKNEQQLVNFAHNFAGKLHGFDGPLIIWLEGELGTGKTTFARSLIRALGYKGRVKSPTYGLLEHYQADPINADPGNADPINIVHMDLYRISEPEELEFLGLTDLLDEQTILLVEWPYKGGRWLPEPDFLFEFAYANPGRDLSWKACTDRAQRSRTSLTTT